MDYEPHFEAMRIAQQERELQDRKNQQKQKEEDADKWRRIKLIEDATNPADYKSASVKANDLAIQKLYEIRNKYSDPKNKMPIDELYSSMQKDLMPVAQGYSTYKSNLLAQEELAKEAVKENPNLNLQKLLVDLQKTVDDDLLVQDEKGGISFNPVKIGTQNDYLSKLLSKDNAWKYSQGADELLKIIREGKGTPKEFFSQAKDKSQINWSANVPFYGKLNVEPNPETGLIPEGVMPKVELVGTPQEYVDIDGKKKTINVVNQKTMDDILFNDRLKTQFDYLWNTHKEEIKKTNPNFSVLPSNEEDLKRVYFSHLLNDNGLPQPHISARTHLPPQPRVTNNIKVGDKTVTINDVSSKIDDVMNDPEAGINVGGKRIGTVMNKLPLDAFNVVVDLVNSKRPTESQIDPNEMFLANIDGQRKVYRIAGKDENGNQKIIIDDAYLVGVLPRTTVNTKVNTDTRRKEKVLQEGDTKIVQPQSKKFNVIDPNTGKIILSGVDEQSANKARAKGYKIQ
jgi:hypothetical protein